MKTALVIGAGPAGLMAAEALVAAGLAVTIADAMPSPGRKLLMAGKSGLNLTKDEPLATFLSAYDNDRIREIVADFGPAQVQDWAQGLGVETFTGSSIRVFPREMKASPLLRAWLGRMPGVRLQTRWLWRGWEGAALVFDTPEGRRLEQPDVTILALGGASFPRLGATGAWVDTLAKRGVQITALAPANAGVMVDWSPHMQPFYGAPIKAVRVLAGTLSVRGEFVISRRGLEGSAIYAVAKAVRTGSTLHLDLLPDLSQAEVATRLAKPRGKASLSNHLRKALRLDKARLALLNEFGRPLPQGPALAARLKKLPIRHKGLRPIKEAISTAGGVAFADLNDNLMLENLPGVFVAGEMLDWEAPTGGYLLTACFASGRHAGRAAAKHALGKP